MTASGRVSVLPYALRIALIQAFAAAVQFRLILAFKIAGLIGTKHTATDVTSANCPIELPQNAA